MRCKCCTKNCKKCKKYKNPENNCCAVAEREARWAYEHAQK